MNIIKSISLVIALFTIGGCESILSNRSNCPCYLTIDFSALENQVKDIHIWIIDSNNTVIYSDYIPYQNYKEFYEVAVPKGHLKVHAWGNAGINTTIENLKSSNSTLIISQNRADSLFSQIKEINTNREIVIDTIRVRSEFATLKVEVLNAGLKDSLNITISNATKGFFINRDQINSLTELTPSGMKSKNGIIFTCSILRQESMLKDLTLNIKGKINGESYNFYYYPLGQKLINSDYDMSAPELESISVTINSTLSLIKINALDWEHIDNQEIKI